MKPSPAQINLFSRDAAIKHSADIELLKPVVLELDPEEADLQRLAELGCDVFTSVDALRNFVERSVVDPEPDLGLDPDPVVTPDPRWGNESVTMPQPVAHAREAPALAAHRRHRKHAPVFASVQNIWQELGK